MTRSRVLYAMKRRGHLCQNNRCRREILLRKKSQRAIHPRGVFARLLDLARGREQKLVRAGDDLPLLLISYPRGRHDVALDLEVAYSHTLGSLPESVRAPYRPMPASLPAIVV